MDAEIEKPKEEEKQETLYYIKQSHAQFLLNYILSRPRSEFMNERSPAFVCEMILTKRLEKVEDK